jgi:competence protein ComEA
VENFLTSSRNRFLLLAGFAGLILVGAGIFFFKSGINSGGAKVEVLNSSTEVGDPKNITAEISGEVINPGVYKFSDGSRIDDLLQSADGLSANADRTWTDKYLNRAAKLVDGQKVFIPKVGEQSNSLSAKTNGGDQSGSLSFSSDSKGLININSASMSQLDTLPGIGQVYGQSIIEHRPYSNVEELLSKGVLKKSLYDKVKNLVSIY